VKIQAIGSTEFDDLIAKHPAEKGSGDQWESKTFGPRSSRPAWSSRR